MKNVSQQFWDKFYGKDGVRLPCTELENVGLEYLDSMPWEESEDSLLFQIFFRDSTFKNITEEREYDLKQLVGDIGGCVGFILGYALVRMPDIVWNILSFWRSRKQKLELFFRKNQVNATNNAFDINTRCNNRVSNHHMKDWKEGRGETEQNKLSSSISNVELTCEPYYTKESLKDKICDEDVVQQLDNRITEQMKDFFQIQQELVGWKKEILQQQEDVLCRLDQLEKRTIVCEPF